MFTLHFQSTEPDSSRSAHTLLSCGMTHTSSWDVLFRSWTFYPSTDMVKLVTGTQCVFYFSLFRVSRDGLSQNNVWELSLPPDDIHLNASVPLHLYLNYLSFTFPLHFPNTFPVSSWTTKFASGLCSTSPGAQHTWPEAHLVCNTQVVCTTHLVCTTHGPQHRLCVFRVCSLPGSSQAHILHADTEPPSDPPCNFLQLPEPGNAKTPDIVPHVPHTKFCSDAAHECTLHISLLFTFSFSCFSTVHIGQPCPSICCMETILGVTSVWFLVRCVLLKFHVRCASLTGASILIWGSPWAIMTNHCRKPVLCFMAHTFIPKSPIAACIAQQHGQPWPGGCKPTHMDSNSPTASSCGPDAAQLVSVDWFSLLRQDKYPAFSMFVTVD